MPSSKPSRQSISCNTRASSLRMSLLYLGMGKKGLNFLTSMPSSLYLLEIQTKVHA